MKELSSDSQRYRNTFYYFKRLPLFHAFLALSMHHAVVRHWLARPMVKNIDEWISSVFLWGLVKGGKLIREFCRNKSLAAIPEFSSHVTVRPQCSDRSVFSHVFIYSAYALKTPRPDDVKWIIDAGANVGYSALFFAGQYPNAQVVAIEPNEANYQQLLSNTRQCDRIKAWHGALWFSRKRLYPSLTQGLMPRRFRFVRIHAAWLRRSLFLTS